MISRVWSAASGSMPEGTALITRARRAASRQRRQAGAEPGSARWEPMPTMAAR
jgi:hypothetical protein